MAGLEVVRSNLDAKSAEAIISVRNAFGKVETVAKYLATVPADAPGGDVLTMSVDSGGFGYNADEAYLIRYVFQSLEGLNLQAILDTARKLTGLE